ncbi:hypothetical protein TEA_029298 [Camellia sinensis var. sinensis]|uniref:F-box domain-containing protein n=1 Tax=Camellia sinensis var. sinensis TaxID=542762 RepID=A0A4S4EQB8_CAMSN|nr:hypothetical protein TEA_029298 [Camellia sinensis var. sinensis]
MKQPSHPLHPVTLVPYPTYEKMTEKVSNKRRKLVIGSTSLEDSLAVEVVVNNVDLLTEILLHVLAKSLLRFKCVSMHWLSLISDSQFSHNHTHRNNNSLISGIYFYCKLWMFKELNSVSFHSHSSLPTLAFLNGVGEGSIPRIVCSCNGLLFCSKVYRKRYIVCNPTTQKYTALPEPAGTLSRFLDHKFGAHLAFDPSKSPHYKVVLVHYSFDLRGRSGSSYVIDIYSSESASWKHIRVIAPPGHSLRCRVFSNGAIHWMTSTNLYIRFDVDAKNLARTPMPPYPKILSNDNILHFGECHGHLFLIQNQQVLPLRFRILKMDKDYCYWKVKYWINLRPVESIFPEKFHQFSVVCIVKGANEKDFALVFNIYGNFISYNLDRKTWKVLLDFQPEELGAKRSSNLLVGEKPTEEEDKEKKQHSRNRQNRTKPDKQAVQEHNSKLKVSSKTR